MVRIETIINPSAEGEMLVRRADYVERVRIEELIALLLGAEVPERRRNNLLLQRILENTLTFCSLILTILH